MQARRWRDERLGRTRTRKDGTMSQLPWRFVVVTDVGVDSGRPTRVERGRVGDWLRAVRAGADIAASGGRPATRLTLDSAESFTPSAIASQLRPASAGGEGAATIATTELDAVLHDPAFQRVESAHRGLELLLEHAQDAVEVHAVSLPRRELPMRFPDAVYQWALDQEIAPALIVLDVDASHRPAELTMLRELADLADALQAPLVAGAAATFFDLRYLVQVTALPNQLARLATPAHQPWQAFQAEQTARWVALTLGRYLQRGPYTEATGFPETVSESNPDTFLWGRGVWLVAAAAARSIREHGHPLSLSGSQGGKFENLATRPFPRAANEQVALATEAPIAETQVLELSRAAFTPVVGVLRAAVAVLPTVVTTYRRAPGKLTVEGTLAYQMMAARLAQRCGIALGAATGGEDLVQRLRSGLAEELGELAERAGDGAVTVEMRPGTGGGPPVADVRVVPGVVLEGKPVEFGFALPVRV
jgi:hypothetical protein